jgi:hypothetical protein
MRKINKLTKAQEAAMPAYVKKWTDIGRATGPVDRTAAERCMAAAYQAATPPLSVPRQYIWVRSPKEGIEVVYRLKHNIKEGAPLTKEQLKITKEEIYNAGYGNHDAGWLSFYDFFLTEVKLSVVEPLRPLIELASHCNWYFPFEEVVIMCERPIAMYFKDNNLHKDGGMALEYSDGFGVYSLNGVLMPKEYVLTPANKLDPKIVLKEQNAEVRRELVRKIGVNVLIEALGAKVLDAKGTYELLSLDLGDGNYRPYLKMKNPSIDAIHVEGVHPTCTTVSAALAWRNGLKVFTNPLVLT